MTSKNRVVLDGSRGKSRMTNATFSAFLKEHGFKVVSDTSDRKTMIRTEVLERDGYNVALCSRVKEEKTK